MDEFDAIVSAASGTRSLFGPTPIQMYPVCDKVAANKEKTQLIGEFLEWLQNVRHITLCETHIDEGRTMDLEPIKHLVPIRLTIEDLLAEFFKIDQKEWEREKQSILAELKKK